MTTLFNKPQVVVTAPGMDGPAFQTVPAISSIEIRVVKQGWPVDAVVTCWMDYSIDNQQTWGPGGSVTDDGSKTRDMILYAEFNPPLPAGGWWKAHVTNNKDVNCSVKIIINEVMAPIGAGS